MILLAGHALFSNELAVKPHRVHYQQPIGYRLSLWLYEMCVHLQLPRMMRNALIEEGGSGVPIDRAAYTQSVEYWSKHAIVQGDST